MIISKHKVSWKDEKFKYFLSSYKPVDSLSWDTARDAQQINKEVKSGHSLTGWPPFSLQIDILEMTFIIFCVETPGPAIIVKRHFHLHRHPGVQVSSSVRSLNILELSSPPYLKGLV